MKASLQQQPMYCSRDHNYPSRFNQQYEKSTQYLDKSCLTEEEKEDIMKMLYKYKDAFSLRDETGTCPNIKVEIDVTDKSPFS